MYIVNDDIPLGCVYEGENGKTKYCPMLNHDDVQYCQYLEDDEAAIGIEERPVYCPIVEFPSADVQPVRRGHWETIGNRTWWGLYECSECHLVCSIDYTYCPHCGARMDGAT